MTDALLQVFLIIGVGVLVAWLGWIDEQATQVFSGLITRVFLPALLFRAMASVDFQTLSVGPIVAYLSATLTVFILVYFLAARYAHWFGAARGSTAGSALPGSAVGVHAESAGGLAASAAISATFSNNVMIGIPLVKLFYGPEGLVVLLTVLTMHSLVMLGAGIVGFEMSVRGRSRRSKLMTLKHLIQSAVLHPIVIPIYLGLVVSLMGWELPVLIDSTLASMGNVAVPACLVLLGASVFQSRHQVRPKGVAPVLVFKLVIHPVLVFVMAQFVLQLPPMTVAVLTTMASLPTGSNPYLLSQRYNQGVSLAATAVVATTAMTAISLPYVLSLFSSIR
jgi:malonate transporter and related proteins